MPGSRPTTPPGPRSAVAGPLLGLTAATLWGSQFPVAKSLFRAIDPYTLTAVRYAAASLIFVALLVVREGRASVRFDGLLRRSWALGSIGLIGAVLLVYVGLEHATAQGASLVVALQPLLTAVVVRVRGGIPIPRITAGAIAVALVGVALVISRGDPSFLVDGSLGWGLLLVLVGQVGWIIYTIESASFADWSPLRFTTLTVLPGTLTLVLLAALAAVVGLAHPTAHALASSPWLLAFTIVGPAAVAVLAWNEGRARIGAQNIALFQNAVPITTFAIETARGYRPHVVELVGACLTIGALVVNNLAQRGAAGPGPVLDEGGVAVDAASLR